MPTLEEFAQAFRGVEAPPEVAARVILGALEASQRQRQLERQEARQRELTDAVGLLIGGGVRRGPRGELLPGEEPGAPSQAEITQSLATILTSFRPDQAQTLIPLIQSNIPLAAEGREDEREEPGLDIDLSGLDLEAPGLAEIATEEGLVGLAQRGGAATLSAVAGFPEQAREIGQVPVSLVAGERTRPTVQGTALGQALTEAGGGLALAGPTMGLSVPLALLPRVGRGIESLFAGEQVPAPVPDQQAATPAQALAGADLQSLPAILAALEGGPAAAPISARLGAQAAAQQRREQALQALRALIQRAGPSQRQQVLGAIPIQALQAQPEIGEIVREALGVR